MAKKNLFGVIPPIVTPIDEHEHVDEKGLRSVIDYCYENGIHGIFVCGSNGECMALTQEQRNEAIRIAVDECAGKLPVIAGVMDASTERVIENVKVMEQLGCDTAVVTPVFYARHATQNETVEHFAEISRRTEADLMIYNIPSFTSQKLTADTIIKISQIDKVIGVKDTSNDMAQFIKLLNYFKGSDFLVFQGSTNLAVPSMLMGADGYVPSLAAAYPKAHIKLYEYGKARDIDNCMKWGKIVDDICKIYPMAKSQTSSTKYAVSKFCPISYRACKPTEPITAEEMANIDAYMETLKQYL